MIEVNHTFVRLLARKWVSHTIHQVDQVTRRNDILVRCSFGKEMTVGWDEIPGEPGAA